MKTAFSTPEYQGAWFDFDDDRMKLRLEIEADLRRELNDPEGRLIVDERGPHWKGRVTLKGLSYSHTKGVALLVYSQTHELGVDVESLHREFSQEPTKLAARFFSEAEAKRVKTRTEVLELWVQKEAYAKLTREGLKETIRIELSRVKGLILKKIPKIPVGYEAWVSLR